MGPTAKLRLRRSAAQLHALVQVEREIRSADPHARRKYLRDFSQAFSEYESVLTPADLLSLYLQTDVLLVGDYHALPASQRFAAELLQELKLHSHRPVVLGVETVFTRDQRALEQWWRGEIGAQELRQRIRFDAAWGYDWRPFFELLEAARHYADVVYGLDCLPRNDLRRIAVRDRHAAAKIAEIRMRHPEAILVVLFGESHLAPNHLPQLLRARRPQDRLLTILQNVDSLYWRAAGEQAERVDAVRVSRDVICVFNSTPLEKYQSYRLCIERWRQERPKASPDLAPAFYNIVDALLRFLNITSNARYTPSTAAAAPSSGALGCQPHPGLPVDLLPEVHYCGSDEQLRRLLQRKGAIEAESKSILAHVRAHGICYWPRSSAVFVREFQLVHGAEEAARFLHHACRGAAKDRETGSSASLDDRFYTRVIEEALAYFGSRALYPARPAVRESDLFSLYSDHAPAEQSIQGHREYMLLIDFLVLHKDYETHLRDYRERPPLLVEGIGWSGERFQYVTRYLGHMLGSELYDAYLSGSIARRFVRSLFFRSLQRPGAARTAYFSTQRRLRKSQSPQPRRGDVV